MWQAYVSILAINVLLPVFALYLLHLSSKSTGILAFLQWLTGFLGLLFIGRVARWEITGLWWPAIVYVLGALLTLKMIQHAIKSEDSHLESKPNTVMSLLFLGMTVGFIYLNSLLFSKPPSDLQSVDLEFPLRTPWVIAQGGNTVLMNTHQNTESQSQSLDIVGLTFGSSRADGVAPVALEQYVIFEKPVFSPCDGEIIAVEGRFPDQEIGDINRLYPAGNYVIIHCSNSSILLAHLCNGSITVDIGDIVTKGQVIGKVGNSGNSTEPHLHIQAVVGKVDDVQMFVNGAKPVVMTFGGRYLKRGEFGD